MEELRSIILEWNSWLKELVDAGQLQPWIFSINQHFLLHILDLILYLGSMPSYAAFSIERTIQEYKSRMKSRKSPTTNSGNVLLELASLHWIECMAAVEIKEKTGEILLDDNEEIEYEVWGPISRVELGNSADILGFDCSPFLKKYFEYQSPGVHTDLDSRSIVELGCRA